jgi:hypothetical protein
MAIKARNMELTSGVIWNSLSRVSHSLAGGNFSMQPSVTLSWRGGLEAIVQGQNMTHMDFRFLMFCESALYGDDGSVSARGIIKDLRMKRGESAELIAILSVIMIPQHWGKRLDLMAWRLGRNGEREKLEGGYVGTPLILPREKGPIVNPCKITIPPQSTSGIFGFDLFDPGGVFYKETKLLATYVYGIEVVD